MTRLSCWSCIEYSLPEYKETPECRLGKEGFPDIGDNCPIFTYDPGSDEEERDANV